MNELGEICCIFNEIMIKNRKNNISVDIFHKYAPINNPSKLRLVELFKILSQSEKDQIYLIYPETIYYAKISDAMKFMHL